MKTISITVDENLYYSLKKQVPAGKLSKYVSDAIKNKISANQENLALAYKEANQDKERNKTIEDWKSIDAEGI
ncbi:MAG: hypothetical protein RLN62_06330 [Rickettsiales bacterium]